MHSAFGCLSMLSSCCCRCNGSGRCKNCVCVEAGRTCSNCLPTRRGRCRNTSSFLNSGGGPEGGGNEEGLGGGGGGGLGRGESDGEMHMQSDGETENVSRIQCRTVSTTGVTTPFGRCALVPGIASLSGASGSVHVPPFIPSSPAPPSIPLISSFFSDGSSSFHLGTKRGQFRAVCTNSQCCLF